MHATDTPDAILIERFKNGDTLAMDRLVNRYLPRLNNYAMRLTHDRDMAADVIGDSLRRMNRSAAKFKGQSTFSTYLYTVTRNCFLDQRKRAQTKTTESLDELYGGEDGPVERQNCSAEPSPHDLLERKVREQTLGEAVALLPSKYRDILTLFYVDARSYEEMSRELGVPLGTVKSRLNRARRALRDGLEGEHVLFGVSDRLAA